VRQSRGGTIAFRQRRQDRQPPGKFFRENCFEERTGSKARDQRSPRARLCTPESR
jgi:hypothetical protein